MPVNSYIDYMNSHVCEFIYMYMNSYDFFKFTYKFISFMNSYMNLGVPRFQMGKFMYTLLRGIRHST